MSSKIPPVPPLNFQEFIIFLERKSGTKRPLRFQEFIYSEAAESRNEAFQRSCEVIRSDASPQDMRVGELRNSFTQPSKAACDSTERFEIEQSQEVLQKPLGSPEQRGLTNHQIPPELGEFFHYSTQPHPSDGASGDTSNRQRIAKELEERSKRKMANRMCQGFRRSFGQIIKGLRAQKSGRTDRSYRNSGLFGKSVPELKK